MSLINENSARELILFQILLDLTGSIGSLTTAVQHLSLNANLDAKLFKDVADKLDAANKRQEAALQHSETFIKSLTIETSHGR